MFADNGMTTLILHEHNDRPTLTCVDTAAAVAVAAAFVLRLDPAAADHCRGQAAAAVDFVAAAAPDAAAAALLLLLLCLLQAALRPLLQQLMRWGAPHHWSAGT